MHCQLALVMGKTKKATCACLRSAAKTEQTRVTGLLWGPKWEPILVPNLALGMHCFNGLTFQSTRQHGLVCQRLNFDEALILPICCDTSGNMTFVDNLLDTMPLHLETWCVWEQLQAEHWKLRGAATFIATASFSSMSRCRVHIPERTLHFHDAVPTVWRMPEHCLVIYSLDNKSVQPSTRLLLASHIRKPLPIVNG